ncbi:MAG: 3-isopropylmalate dehydratase large subunit [Candidatus Neomarinimicrobiota bacterium]|jgi:3-isopropylmalate/(R)-2-methylmalate dehydratase large subunit|nr:3-isopropylmalate dehydratase large subunit [Candidatus Neomarinimicrobiota bacterium]MDD3965516.1 3-isopropylmalate dehydratase large subunit [Candidatus Neomarinimicrobiota bacterium]MDX9780381.1 3-isopropylmalate dehydratase large subunit [bacterium]
MGMTITEKILARHSAHEKVSPGMLINAGLDLIMCHDVTTTPAIDMLKKQGIQKVFDPRKIVIMPDHFVPNKDIKSAEMIRKIRLWARENGIDAFYELGRHGVCHALLPEQGYVLPGMTIVGADSHTCTHGAFAAFSTGIGSTDLAAALATGELWFKVPSSLLFRIRGKLPKGVYAKDLILEIIRRIGVDGALYRAMEFRGDTVENMGMEERMTLCNMAIEAGAKSGIIAADQVTAKYLQERGIENYSQVESDPDAVYEKTYEIDTGSLEPLLAFPHLPSNVRPVSEIKEKIPVDQAYIGSCTNGHISDLRIAAQILKGKKVASGTRCIVVPASTEIWKQANREGLLDIFTEAGAAVSTPTCGACLGGHMGILAAGERCVSTTNRNFVGRMGSPDSEVYLASPATAAASAICGYICDPRTCLEEKS